MDRGHLDQEPDRKFGRSATGGQVRDQIARDRGVINLRRLSNQDKALLSPRLPMPLGAGTPGGDEASGSRGSGGGGIFSRLGGDATRGSGKRGRGESEARDTTEQADTASKEMPPPGGDAQAEAGEEAKRRRKGSVAVVGGAPGAAEAAASVATTAAGAEGGEI